MWQAATWLDSPPLTIKYHTHKWLYKVLQISWGFLYISKDVPNHDVFCKISGNLVNLGALSQLCWAFKACKEGFRHLTLLPPGFPPASAALWTGSLVLGLLLLVFLTHRLWKCCQTDR